MAGDGSDLDDAPVNVRVKIVALWISMLFLFAYGDIFGFFAPGHIDEIQNGTIWGSKITQGFLLAVSTYVAIASLMVFLTLVLRPTFARWTNIVLALLYIVSIVASAVGETDAYFLLLSGAEIALLLLVIHQAWRWPTRPAFS